MKFLIVSIVVIFSSLSSWAGTCDLVLEEQNLCVEIEWVAGPQVRTESRAKVTLTELDTQRATDQFRLKSTKIWMPHHGHGSRPITLKKTGVGEYSLTKVYFVMPGHWDLHLGLEGVSQKLELKKPIHL